MKKATHSIAHLPIRMLPQPDDTTCGPTCLQTIYSFYGDEIPLLDLIQEVEQLEEGGTLGAWLAVHALKRGYRAKIYTYNLTLFDPTWFGDGSLFIRDKLLQQAKFKTDIKLQTATQAYIEFLDLGGVLELRDLSPALIGHYLKRGIPVMAGLSATYLYGSPREYGPGYDDIQGLSTGHFVVLNGYDRKHRYVQVADPLHDNPTGEGHNYRIGVDRVINAILLGIVTYDANLVILTPKAE